jgi:hypothetical protein
MKKSDSDQQIGGAIRNVTMVDVKPARTRETVAESIDRIHQELALDEDLDWAGLQPFIANLSMEPVLEDPFFAQQYWFDVEDDKELLQNMKPDLSGHGAHKDSHQLQRLVHKSFEHHPELLKIYVNGKV